MSAEIEIKNGIPSMIHVGEAPWHGNSIKLETPPENTTITCRLASMDYEVETVPLFRSDGTPSKARAIIRKDTGREMGYCGKNSHFTQNLDFFKFLDPYIAGGFGSIETAGVLRGGARAWMLLKINTPDMVIVPGADDRVTKYILLAQGLDGVFGIHFGLTGVRVVCKNTLAAAVDARDSSLLRIHHTKNHMNTLEGCKAVIDSALAQFAEAEKAYKALAGVQVTVDAVKQYVNGVFYPGKKPIKKIDASSFMADLSRESQKADLVEELAAEDQKRRSRIADEVMELFEHGTGNDVDGVRGTGWAAYNAATEFLSHKRGRSDDVRQNNLWFDDQAASTRALSLAIETFLVK